MKTSSFFAERAWVAGGWARDVLLTVSDGSFSAIRTDCPPDARQGAASPQGPVLPGLVNAHSHAFQRAMAGLAERSAEGQDDFWGWRERMYAAALRISPQQLEAVASYLYAEFLRCGYTHVCEFHYLHNDVDGKPYPNTLEMSQALVRAAEATGIGLTLLPTLYMRAGFATPALRDDQRRFASRPEGVLRMAETLRRHSPDPQRVTAGIALHSLRAVEEGALRELAKAARGKMPIHIHIAEQQREVADCLERHGHRPIEWLLRNAELDASWNLVHATQANRDELLELRAREAAIVICPGTEANLGDGIFDLPTWFGASGRWSVGSDSHITRSWQEELRLLEYSQRLATKRRNLAAEAALTQSSAAALFDGAMEGGSAAAGLPMGGIAVGQRADFCVIDTSSPALLGIPEDFLLDAFVFSSPEAKFAQTYVAGKKIEPRDHGPAFVKAMNALWT